MKIATPISKEFFNESLFAILNQAMDYIGTEHPLDSREEQTLGKFFGAGKETCFIQRLYSTDDGIAFTKIVKAGRNISGYDIISVTEDGHRVFYAARKRHKISKIGGSTTSADAFKHKEYPLLVGENMGGRWIGKIGGLVVQANFNKAAASLEKAKQPERNAPSTDIQRAREARRREKRRTKDRAIERAIERGKYAYRFPTRNDRASYINAAARGPTNSVH